MPYPIIAMACYGDADGLRIMIEAGADVNKTGGKWHSALQASFCDDSDSKRPDFCSSLQLPAPSTMSILIPTAFPKVIKAPTLVLTHTHSRRRKTRDPSRSRRRRQRLWRHLRHCPCLCLSIRLLHSNIPPLPARRLQYHLRRQMGLTTRVSHLRSLPHPRPPDRPASQSRRQRPLWKMGFSSTLRHCAAI